MADTSNKTDARRIDTKLIHAGEPRPLIGGAVSMPIFQSSTFAYSGQGDYDALRYIRLNNTPNHVALHEKLAALEGGGGALVTASGMAAISATLLTLLSPGDHFLAQAGIYGGTHSFIVEDLARFGIACDFIDGNAPETWADRLTRQTRLIYMEAISNPLMDVADLAAAAEFARRNGLSALIDNTFATPVNFRPMAIGFDLVLHSCTKYLNGHSDMVAGAVIGSADLIRRITRTANHLGGALDPHACFLLHRGLKTLAVRMRHQNASAMAVARFLSGHPAVARVHYPGLPDHPAHERAARLFIHSDAPGADARGMDASSVEASGVEAARIEAAGADAPGANAAGVASGFGGMISFELKGDVALADRFISCLRLPISAPSLGGVESLITRPATTSHSGVSPEERRAMGVTDTLIRLSVGLEDAADLIADLGEALAEAG